MSGLPRRRWAGLNRGAVAAFLGDLRVFGRQTHPSQTLLQGVQDDELGEVEVLLRGFSKYPLHGSNGPRKGHMVSGEPARNAQERRQPVIVASLSQHLF